MSSRGGRFKVAIGGAVLLSIATIVGLLGVALLDMAGLGWSGGFFRRLSWDESESVLTLSVGVMLLVIWLGLLVAAFFVLRRERQSATSASWWVAILATALSVMILLVACIVLLGRAEPPSEYPLPPWNRA